MRQNIFYFDSSILNFSFFFFSILRTSSFLWYIVKKWTLHYSQLLFDSIFSLTVCIWHSTDSQFEFRNWKEKWKFLFLKRIFFFYLHSDDVGALLFWPALFCAWLWTEIAKKRTMANVQFKVRTIVNWLSSLNFFHCATELNEQTKKKSSIF